MGLIPLLFEKLKLNNNKIKSKFNALANHSFSVTDLSMPIPKRYTKSIIVNDITPKTMGENFTFINKNDLDYNN
jgi:hypothetical protein